MQPLARAVLAAALAAQHASAQSASFARATVPDSTPARVGSTSIFYPSVGSGTSWFLGGRDGDSNRVTTTTQITSTGASTVSIATSAPPFVPLEGATPVHIGQTGFSGTGNPVDPRIYFFGGGTNGVAASGTINLAVFDPSTASFTATVTTDGPQPVARVGATAAYVRQCDVTNPANPKPCIVLFGGASSSGLLNDAWALWFTETPRPRWQQVMLNRPTPAAGQPTQRRDAAAGVSSDGSVMYIYGGVSSAGAVSDVFAVAPIGFPDPQISEMINVARSYRELRNSSTSSQWTVRGAISAVDGVLSGMHDATGFSCTHSNGEFTPWWGIRLNGTQNIGAIRIIPRSDGSLQRIRLYRMFMTTVDPNPGGWPAGGPPTDAQLAGAFAGAELTNTPLIVNSPVVINLPAPRPTEYFWFSLRNTGDPGRILSLCEVELYVKNTWVWRQLSGVSNVALGKRARQSTQYSGQGLPEFAVDGNTNGNNYGVAPATCTHTGTAPPAGRPQFWQVDLGDVYDISSMRFFPRTECCTAARLRDWSIFAGLSRNNFAGDSLCWNGPLRNQNNALITDGQTTAFQPVNCQVRARYVTVQRPNNYGTASSDNSVISICEAQVYAERMLNLPVARRDFSSAVFRGHLVVYGGSDARGFRQNDLRFLNLDTGKWLPPATLIGSPPTARSLAGMAVLGPHQMVIHGGSTSGDASAEVAVLTFPTCPALDVVFNGVASVICNSAGTSCVYTCLASAVDVNNGKPVVCLPDGTLSGSIPPCVFTTTPIAPTGLRAVWNNVTSRVLVNWDPPIAGGVLGYYGNQFGLSALQVTRVRARIPEHMETFESGFKDPFAWFQWVGNGVPTNSATNFQDGRMVLTAAAQTEYWGGLVDNNALGLGFSLVPTTTRTAHLMVREWPASVDPAGEWAMETEIQALGQFDGSAFSMGVMDMGLRPGGDAHFVFGIRYTDAAGFMIQLESLGGRASRLIPALSDRVFLRIERVFLDKELDFGNTNTGVFRMFYKYTSAAPWVRVYDIVSHREMLGVFWNATNNTLTGPGGRPRNFRPFFMAKSTNANDYSRGSAAFSYLRITQGVELPGPGTVRMLNHPMADGSTANNTFLAGLTPGSSYTIEVQWKTTAGYGTAATVPITIPSTQQQSQAVVWGTREVAQQRPAWMSSQYSTAWAAFGNDGNWFAPTFHTGCTTNGEWWGVDLGVDYAAVKHIVLRNRCDSATPFNVMRNRRFSVFVGQDARGARTTNVWVDQRNWDNFTMSDPARAAARENNIGNVPVRHLSYGAFNATLNRVEPYPFSATAWASDPNFCRFQIPTVGYGRYLYFSNAQGTNDGCLHLTEIQVFVTNTCPLRSATGGAVVDTTGGRGCDLANNRYGRVCAFTCPSPTVLVYGVASVTCNGEVWVGGAATPVVCGLECPAIEAPAFSDIMVHTILDEDFTAMTATEINRIGSINPIISPFSSVWTFVDNRLQASSKLGLEREAAAAFTIEKIRLMPRSDAFTYSATFVTDDAAGILFRIQDGSGSDYYRAYVDVARGVHGLDAVVAGVPVEVGRVNMELDASQAITLSVSVQGEFMNMTINGYLVLQVSDSTFAQGNVGLYAQSTASFQRVVFSKFSDKCEGVTAGETCTVSCLPGLRTVGNSLLTCQSNGAWSSAAPTCTVDPPSFPPATLTVRENSGRNTLVGNPLAAASSSPEYPVSFSVLNTYTAAAGLGLPLASPLGADLFSVDFCSGQVKVRRIGFLDFESMHAYTLEVRAYIAGFSLAFTDRNVTINVLDVDEPPTVNRTTIFVPENTVEGAQVGTVQVIDPENHPVSFSIITDASNGRFAVNPVTGAITVMGPPGNRTGSASMFTGADAPINFETTPSMDLVISVRQTGGMGGDTALSGSGTVTLTLTDSNDPPILFPDQTIFIAENQFIVNGVVGIPSTLDEDTNGPATVFSQALPSACGITDPARVPNRDVPPGSATLTLSGGGQNNLFTVDPSTGEIRVAAQPAQGYAVSVSTVDVWPVFLAQSRALRAMYHVCITASDGVASVTHPVTVAVVADLASAPAVEAIIPSTFPTGVATVVHVVGVNFWPAHPGGTAPTVTAEYSNGIDSYNATGCVTLNNTHIRCSTVPGVGGNMEWTFVLNSRRIVSVTPVTASYIAPVITSISQATSMPTGPTGRFVFIYGTNLGPLANRRVRVTYGPTGVEFTCAVSTSTGSSSLIYCQASNDAGGAGLLWQVTVGGQLASAPTLTTFTWSYAAPTIARVTPVIGAGGDFGLDGLNPMGGQVISINGTNFGGLNVPMQVTYGTVTGTLYALPCTKTDATTAHVRLLCTVPPGVGAGHAIVVTVAGQSTAPFMALGGQGLTYSAPIIMSITGSGWKNADTVGLQEILITGDNFGPATVLPLDTNTPTQTIDFVTYGPSGNTGLYTASNCVIRTPGNPGTISCLSSPGVGRGLRLDLSIGGQRLNVTGRVWPVNPQQVLTLGGSYAPPSIISFSGAGAAGANTVGGQSVVITGRNFGPADSYTSARLSVSYGTALQTPVNDDITGRPVIANVTYIASGCAITVAHTEITCTSVEGAGTNLAWDVTVAGQKSATPTTNYAAPVINTITLETATGTAVGSADVNGGTIAVLSGSFFGPSVYASGRSLVQSVTFGTLGTEYTIPPRDWLSVGHATIRVRLPAGMGNGLTFRVAVADQPSTSSPGAVFDYTPPEIVLIEPSTISTFSDKNQPTLITLVTRNLPLRDTQARIMVAFGGSASAGLAPRIISPVIPQGTQAVLGATNMAGALAGTVNITFQAPEHGGGKDVAVQIQVLRGSSTAIASSSAVTSATLMQYADPVIRDVVVSRALWKDVQNSTSPDAVDCPFSGSAWSCTDMSVYRLDVMGRDFTSQLVDWQDGVTRGLELFLVNDGIQGDIYSTNTLWLYKWDHTQITFFARAPTGRLRMTIGSTAYDGTARTQVLVRAYQDQSPLINAINGPTANIPTTGGDLNDPLVLSVEALSGATNVEVKIGSFNGILLRPGSQAGTYTVITNVGAWLSESNNPQNNNNLWTVYVQLPPGQGRNLPVVVFKTSIAGVQGSNSGYTVSYAPPVVTAVQLVVDGVEGATETINAFTAVRNVPTDGRRASIRMYGSNLGVAPVAFVGDGHRVSMRACTITPTPALHTCYEFAPPDGEGNGLDFPEYQPLGFRLTLVAGSDLNAQSSASVGFSYAAATVTRIIPQEPGMPLSTTGYVPVTLIGSNFGFTRNGRWPSILVEFGRPAFPAESWLTCLDVIRISHTVLNCTLPEGSGRGLAARLTIAGIEGVTQDRLSYDAPVITSITITGRTGFGNNRSSFVRDVLPPANGYNRPMLTGQTNGGDTMTITGHNFGVRAKNQHCVFLTWSHRRENPSPARPHVCNDGEDWLGEGEVGYDLVQYWNHTAINITVPAGLGWKDIELSIRGSMLGLPQYSADLWRFVYSPPTLTTLREGDPDGNAFFPTGEVVTAVDTDGGELVTVWGSNMGPSPRNTSSNSEVFTPPLSLSTQFGRDVVAGLPTAHVAIAFHRACITDARTIFGGRPDVSVQIGGVEQNLGERECSTAVTRHEHGRMAFRTGSGIGTNRTIRMMVIDGPQVLLSNALNFTYKAPLVEYFQPQVVYMAQRQESININGRYFGDISLADAQGWNAEERALSVVIGGDIGSCVSVDRFRTADSRTVISCLADEKRLIAGLRNVTVFVAGQVGVKEAISEERGSLLLVCAPGFYGRVNETCLPCPAQSEDPSRRGAECRGYLSDRFDTSNGVRVPLEVSFEDRFRYPRPLKGWYNLNSSDTYTRRVGEGQEASMLPACPPGFQDADEQGVPRDVCIVPCDPPESCLGDNWCAEGYTSKPPMWRCASCDRGFFKRAGECIKCPDSPGALFIGFILLVIVVATVGFMLNKKQINIAVISIGVDFFQVLAIFAQSRIKWPPVVKELLHVLSAFNLNIEIVAPECLIPDVSYKQKFWFIMILPLVIASLFGVSFTVLWAYKALILGRPKAKWYTHSPALVSSCLVLLYLLYLYLTRTIMDVFNCGPVFPPDGKNYLQVVFEECGIPGGTQMTLLPYAIAGLAVYAAGYPVFIGWTLFKNRELVMEDQLLRAKGLGNDRLSNPHAYAFRRMFGRSYFQFKPDWCMWILAILLRKLCIAITAVVFGKNSSFQMAACLLIMFLAYAAQVQIRPYMSAGDFDEVIKGHMEASYTSAIHARLRSVLAGIETRGRKKVRKNLINFEGKVDRAAVLGVLTGFFFNYNTVEAIMTFCAVIVCLMAIMYQANELNSYYPESRDSVTSVTLIIIIWAIVYFFTVFITEIVVLYNEDQRATQLAKAARGKASKKGSDFESGSSSGGKRVEKLVDGEGELNLGKVETATNPMFLKADGGAAISGSSNSDSTIEAILSQSDAPPVELWRVFQQAFSDMQSANNTLKDQLQQARKQLQTGSGAGASGASDEMQSVRAVGKAKTQFAPKSADSSSNTNPLALSGGGRGGGVSLASMRKSSRNAAASPSSSTD